jgi:nitroreductase
MEYTLRVASDIGMYAQSFLLALAARGIGSVPQTVLGFHADVVRKVLGVSKAMKLLFGISFGYPDVEALENRDRMGRDSIENNVSFHSCKIFILLILQRKRYRFHFSDRAMYRMAT